jgi:hypothetical protein
LTNGTFQVNGKVLKEEFVTGGINLKETLQNHGKQA